MSNLQRVGQACAVVIAFVINEYLGFVLQTAEGGRVDDAVPVPLKYGAVWAVLVGFAAPSDTDDAPPAYAGNPLAWARGLAEMADDAEAFQISRKLGSTLPSRMEAKTTLMSRPGRALQTSCVVSPNRPSSRGPESKNRPSTCGPRRSPMTPATMALGMKRPVRKVRARNGKVMTSGNSVSEFA